MRVGFMHRYGNLRIEFAREVGFKSAELIVPIDADCLPGRAGWKKPAQAVKEAFAEAGIRISCVGGPYVNHMDREQAAKFRKYTRSVILLAEYLGVSTVAGFAGKLVDRLLEDSIEPFKKIWSDHAAFAKAHGVRYAFEHCPMGRYHLPPGGNNCMCTPAMWEACFNAVDSDALGLEWDPSHLIGLLIDPIHNLKTWAGKVYHVHAKDAKIDRIALARFGLYAEKVCEHCFPGLGDTDWGQVVKELIRGGYRGDLNIEGWHDRVYHDRLTKPSGRPKGYALTRTPEDLGLVLSYRHLSQFVDEP